MPSRHTDWRVLDTGPGDPAFNMALDEAMLEGAVDSGRPTLRFYGWTVPAATFGYFQRHAEVASWTHLRPLLRRPTGGGLVPHDRDWTYSLALPPDSPWYRHTAVDSYRRLHEWLRRAFEALGVTTSLAPCCNPAGPGQCFVGAERHDLIRDGIKVAGAAQRRNRLGLLIQGSVQPPNPAPGRQDWQQAMATVGSGAGEPERFVSEPPAPALLDRAHTLVATKYGCPAFHERR